MLTNSKNIHAIYHTELNIRGINFFKKGEFDNITAPQELLYLAQEDGNTVKASISNPNVGFRTLKIKIKGGSSVKHGKDIRSRLSDNYYCSSPYRKGRSISVFLYKNPEEQS